MKPITELSVEEFVQVMNVNLTSAFILTKLCAPVMKEKGEGQGSEIATVALFLATSDSSFVDGQLLRVDGGVDC